jgi:SAM-dependent methyltransferase
LSTKRDKVLRYLKKIGIDEQHAVFSTTLQYFCDLSESRNLEIYSYLSDFVNFAGKVVLEVGSGSGSFVRYLREKGIEAYGIEIVPELASLTKDVVCGDALKPPFRDGSFDIVIAVDVIEHIEDQFLLIKKAVQLLRVGGIAFFIANNFLLPYDFDSKLFFIHWLPRPIADRYFRWRRRNSLVAKKYSVNFPHYLKLRKWKNSLDSSTFEANIDGTFRILGILSKRLARLRFLFDFIDNMGKSRFSFIKLFAPKLCFIIKRKTQ